MKRRAWRVPDILLHTLITLLVAWALVPAVLGAYGQTGNADASEPVTETRSDETDTLASDPDASSSGLTGDASATSPAVAASASASADGRSTAQAGAEAPTPFPAAPRYATVVNGIRTATAQDTVPGTHAAKVTAYQDGLTLTIDAAWNPTEPSDEIMPESLMGYRAVEDITISGVAEVRSSADAAGSEPVNQATFLQVIADGWSIDQTALDEAYAAQSEPFSIDGIATSYTLEQVIVDADGGITVVDEGTDGASTCIVFTFDLAGTDDDSIFLRLPMRLDAGIPAGDVAYMPLALDTIVPYSGTAGGDGDLFIGGSKASMGDIAVLATSPELPMDGMQATGTAGEASPSASGASGVTGPASAADSGGSAVSGGSAASDSSATSESSAASGDSTSIGLSVESGQQEGFTVRSFTLIGVTDGTATFDTDDLTGDDSSGTNGRVRSNDSIIYKTSFSLQTTDGDAVGEGYYQGTTRLELVATMPEELYQASGGTAYWDTSAMRWLEDATISDDGRTVTGYMTIDGSSPSSPLAPRVGAMNWVLDTGWATEGTVVADPTFTLTPEGLETSTATVNHEASGLSNMDSVAVTARGRYNAQLRSEGDDLYSVTLQFYNPNGGLKGQALPDTSQAITVTLQTNWNQVYEDSKLNTDAVEGTNGLIATDRFGNNAPLDDGPTTLATTFNTVYDGGTVVGSGTSNTNASIDPGNTITLTISGYALDMTDSTGFTAGSGLVYPDRNADAQSANQSASYDDNTTYNFGAYLFKVATPSGYPIDGGTTIGTVKIVSAAFTQVGGTVSGDTLVTDDVCNLTLGQYPYIHGTSINHMGVVNSSQSTSYDYSRRVGLNNYGIFKLEPDGTKTQVNASASDTYTKVDIGDRLVIDTGEWFGFHSFDAGTDSAGIEVCNASDNIPRYGTLFEKFDGHVFDVDETSTEPTYAYYSYIGDYAFAKVNVNFRYVVKDGGWDDEADQYASHLDADADGRYQDVAPAGSGLIVYDSIEDVRTAQQQDAALEIVGIVADVYIPQGTIDHMAADYVKGQGDRGSFSVHFPTLKVKGTATTDPSTGEAITDEGDARLVAVSSSDATLRTVASSTDPSAKHTYTNWTAAGTTNTGGPQDIRRTSYDTTSAYAKADFDSTGTLVRAPYSHNSMIEGAGTYRDFSNMSGFSYYVQLYTPYIMKSMAQSDGQTEKTGFNIDEGQRRADFVIGSGITGAQTFGSGDTLTITDTIPKGVNPIDPTAADTATRWGIAYADSDSAYQADTSQNGGAGGSWSHDEADILATDVWKAAAAYADANGLGEPTCSLTESTDSTGNTVITWVVSGWPVGYAMPDIHYSGILGTPDDPYMDLVNGDSLTNNATVATSTLPATAAASRTVTVFRQDEATAVKTSVDADGEEYADNRRADKDFPVAFDIEFDNEVEKQADDDISLIDVFPTSSAGNLGAGYTDPGDFTLTDVTFEGEDLADCTLKFFYATEASISAAGTSSAALYADQKSLTGATHAYGFKANAAWREIDISIGSDGSVQAASAAAVKAALEGQRVRAVGFQAGNLRTGSRWKLHLGYDWAEESVRTAMLKDGSFKNDLAFYVNSTKQSGTSSGISLPPLPAPATYDPSVTKVITGSTPAPAATFNFDLTAGSSETPMPAGATGGVAVASVTGAGTVSFGNIVFKKAGTYTYSIHEEAPAAADGYMYDQTVYTLTVYVAPDTADKLVATGTLTTEAGEKVRSATFTNSYTEDISGIKILKAADKDVVVPGDTITYTITATNEGATTVSGIYVKDYVPEQTTYVASSGSGADYGATVEGREFATWWIPSLDPGATDALTMTVKVDECLSCASVSNCALFSTGDPERPASKVDPKENTNTTKTRVDTTDSGSAGSTSVSAALKGAPGTTAIMPKTGVDTSAERGLLILLGVAGALVLLVGTVIFIDGLMKRRRSGSQNRHDRGDGFNREDGHDSDNRPGHEDGSDCEE